MKDSSRIHIFQDKQGALLIFSIRLGALIIYVVMLHMLPTLVISFFKNLTSQSCHSKVILRN